MRKERARASWKDVQTGREVWLEREAQEERKKEKKKKRVVGWLDPPISLSLSLAFRTSLKLLPLALLLLLGRPRRRKGRRAEEEEGGEEKGKEEREKKPSF